MTREVKTRTQRRIERKHAMLLLVMMLAVSLVSFSLGVMVGKSGSPDTSPRLTAQAPDRKQVVQEAAPAKPAPTTPQSEAPPDREKTPLTFFDTLPKSEDSPLGSGINRPPKRIAPQAEKDLSDALENARKTDTETTVKSEAQPTKPAAEVPPVEKDGRFVVQVGSFRSPQDARSLSGRLEKIRLPVFVQQADLGAKGVWYRVRIGPFADSAAAKKIVARLKAEENLDAFVANR